VNVYGTFTMSGWEITGFCTICTGSVNGMEKCFGGGVYVKGAFTMDGGVISGNSAVLRGGGVYVFRGTDPEFIKTGGTIYGDDSAAPDDPQSNTASADGQGHAVYCETGPKYKDTTLGPTGNVSYNYPNTGDVSGLD
jgi:hypothetical protein